MGAGEALRGGAWRTPLGTLVAVASPRGLRSVGFDLDVLAEVDQSPSPVLEAFAAWVLAYFGKRFDRLPDVPLDLGDDLLAVGRALRSVGPGRTVTYGQLAARLGRPPSAARRVGATLARNPVLLVLPCHRVIARSGSLSGYAGGVERKAWLLRHEGALLL